MKSTRREFLSKTVLGAMGAGLALHTLRSEDIFALAQPGMRAERAARSGILLDGAMAGWLESVEGGHATSDVVSGKLGPQTNRAMGGIREDITLNCGTGMSRAFYDWIKASFDGQAMRKSGAIVNCDFNSKEISRLEFTNALISEVGFPALDAASKDAAKITIKISPESTRMAKGTGTAVNVAVGRSAQKKWLPSNFRLKIAGLDCTRVNKIDAITAALQPVRSTTGLIRTGETNGSQGHKLSITLPESEQLAMWQKASVVGGKVGGKKDGQLEYLSEDLREVLFTLTFKNLGIRNVSAARRSDNENTSRVKVELYCEEIHFSYGAWA